MEGAHEGPAARMPRWAKVVGSICVALVLLLFAVLVVGGSQGTPAGHGSGNHMAGAGGSQHGGNHTGSETVHHGPSSNPSDGTRGPVTWTIDVKDDAFAPNNVTIQVGDTVKWVHGGSNPHTVTADQGSFDSHPSCNNVADGVLGRCMASGATYNRTFDQTGAAPYHCKIHQSMVATIHVLKSYNATPTRDHHGRTVDAPVPSGTMFHGL